MKQARLKELFRYFRAASHASNLIYEDIDSPLNYRPDEAPLSTDIVLNGLLQLLVHRLDCDRAFVSLIDDEFQFIIAEATKSISLVDASIHDQGDGICIGTRPLTLDAGICAATMPAFTQATAADGPSIHTANIYADSTRYVINDLTAEDLYKSRPYVCGHPNMRWYAEVPLRTATGHAIGSLAVVDTNSRLGLRDDEYRIMSELASAVMRHLDMLRVGAEHSRAVNLLNGLDKFMHERPSLPSASRQEHLPLKSLDGMEQSARNDPVSLAADVSVAESSDAQSVQSLRTTKTLVTSETLETPPRTETDSVKEIHPNHLTKKEDDHLHFDEAVPTHQEARISIFESAASLLREAADLDGVVFFDASPTVLSRDPASPVKSASLTLDYFNLANQDVDKRPLERQDDVSREKDLPQSQKQYCDRLGYAFRQPKSAPAADSPDGKLLLTTNVMQSLLHHFPKGTIFNLEQLRDATTPVYESDKETSPQILAKPIKSPPSATFDLLGRSGIEHELRTCSLAGRSVVFHPLWNGQTENWYAACLAWSDDTRRVLQSNDLSYITAFSNSIMAEIGSLELLAIDNAKSDFISSISHEVRSPLHGILGSAEILADVIIDKQQGDLVQMIENCGRNLLETMDNILHFSKINSKARTIEKQETPQNSSGRHAHNYELSADLSNFNIAKLVEESVEGLIVSHQHSTSLSAAMHNESQITTESGDTVPKLNTGGKVVVILRVGHEESWIVKSRTVIWQRILANLLGNAMKYTSTGYIEICLSATPRDEKSGISIVTLVVRDTGKGISKSYLDHRLYQPFVQEDTLSPGTGLGLSIVKGLVGEVHGDVSIRSTKGVGTEATVSIPVTFLTESSLSGHPPQSQSLCLLGFDAYPELDAVPTGRLPVNVRQAPALKNALKSTCEGWLRMKASYTNNRSEVDSNIIVIMEDDVRLFKRSPSASGLQSLDIPGNSVLILICVDHTTKEMLAYHEQVAGVYYLSQPFGPLQLTQVMAQIQASLDQARAGKQQHSDSAQHALHRTILQTKPEPTATLTEDGIHTDKHVLLVEDNSVNLQLLVRSMQKMGRKFLTAVDGQQALDMYRARSAEIEHVLMDISMPMMDGFTATREIRAFERQKSLPRIPITMLTGLGSDAAREEAQNCGSDLFLVKPVRLAMLKSLLDGS